MVSSIERAEGSPPKISYFSANCLNRCAINVVISPLFDAVELPNQVVSDDECLSFCAIFQTFNPPQSFIFSG